MIPLFLQPVTRLYFGRPGALPAGEAHVGKSWFPPPISTFQGMVRTRLLDEAGIFSPKDRVAELVGLPDKLPEGWQLQGLFPAARKKRHGGLRIWLPVPAMLFESLDRKSKKPVTARFLQEKSNDLLMDVEQEGRASEEFSLHLLGAPGVAKEKPLRGWLSSGNLFNVLSGQPEQWQPGEYCPDLPPFVGREQQTGLARERKILDRGLALSGQAAEGMLYTLETLRCAPGSGFCGWFRGELHRDLSEEALHQGTVVAGKKSGIMAFSEPPPVDRHWQHLADGDHLSAKGISENRLQVWLILLSPGQWESFAEVENILSSEKLQVRVKGCLCPEIIHLGGFSLAERRPRPAEPWYGAGTSLLLDVVGPDPETTVQLIKEHWNNRCLLAPKTKQPFGYGHVLAGIYKENGENNGK